LTKTLVALPVTLVFWTNDDDWDRRVLETVSADGAGEKTLKSAKGAAACAYD